jgi:hypothetical protein
MPTGKKFRLTLGIISVIMITGLLGACSEQINSPAFAALAVKDQALAGADHQPGLEVEVEGIVQALSTTSLTINGQTFTYDPAVVVQNGFTLQVGAEAKVKGLLVGGQVQVAQIVPGKVEDNTPTPPATVTATVTTTAGPTATPGDDDHHGRGNDDPPGDNRGRGNDGGQDDNTATATPRPTATPGAAATAKATPTKRDDQGDDKGKNGDKGKATATPKPTNPPSATPTPKSSDDKGKGGNDGKGDDKGGGGGKGK